jgi:hypothetical protein
MAANPDSTALQAHIHPPDIQPQEQRQALSMAHLVHMDILKAHMETLKVHRTCRMAVLVLTHLSLQARQVHTFSKAHHRLEVCLHLVWAHQ